MHLKLMIRGLGRHKKRGRRLFVLLALCTAAIVFLLTFQEEFGRQYRDLFVRVQTGHLQVLPPDSPVFDANPFGTRKSEVALLADTDALDAWVLAQPEVEAGAPTLEREVLAYNLDSEFESWMSLVAVPADRRAQVFPGAAVLEGRDDLTWVPGADVPVLHARLQSEWGETNPDPDQFVVTDVLHPLGSWEPWKARITSEFPRHFPDAAGKGVTDAAFLGELNAALAQSLADEVPPGRLEPYNWKIDDALTALRDNTDPGKVKFLNRRLIQALYPKDLAAVVEPLTPGKAVTLQVPPLKAGGAMDLPVLIPARYAGMVDVMPLYIPHSYIDLGAFRHALGLTGSEASAYVIRLKDPGQSPAFQTRLERWLRSQGSNARVADAAFLGKLYLATATAIDAVVLVLVGIFVLILVVFIFNLVLLSLVQRRREIGTGLALGLTNGDTVAILLGEVGVIVVVSWAVGSVVGLALVAGFHFAGIPGMVFFPGQRLWPQFRWEPIPLSLVLLLPAALAAALVPLSGLRRVLPVDLFREAR